MGKWHPAGGETVLVAVLLLIASTGAADAQRPAVEPFVGAGIEVASVPLALRGACGATGTLRGAGPEARAGVRVRRLSIIARGALVARPEDGAVCAPRQDGVHTDYDHDADASALHLEGSVRYSLPGPVPLRLGPEIGSFVNRDTRYVGVVLGARRGRLALEGSLRSYSVGYDAITREWRDGDVVRVISRTGGRESALGAALRLVVETW